MVHYKFQYHAFYYIIYIFVDIVELILTILTEYDFDLIQELLTLQKNKSLLNRKRGLEDDIESRIEEYIKREKGNAD